MGDLINFRQRHVTVFDAEKKGVEVVVNEAKVADHKNIRDRNEDFGLIYLERFSEDVTSSE